MFGASRKRKLGSLAGHTFENLMQDTIRHGSASGEMKLLSKGSGISEPPLPKRKFPKLEYYSLEDFKHVEKNMYYFSENPNEPSVDSFVVMEKNLVLFQFTVAAWHPVEARGLEKVITKVRSSVGPLDSIYLVFVLPEYRYVEWKSPQTFVLGKIALETVPESLQTVAQYALFVEEEATRRAFQTKRTKRERRSRR